MCHEEISYRDRVDLAAHHPGSRECKRSPCVAGQLLIREQRLLILSRVMSSVSVRAQHYVPLRAAGAHLRHGVPPAGGFLR